MKQRHTQGCRRRIPNRIRDEPHHLWYLLHHILDVAHPGYGLGFTDDIFECAFASSRLACLRSIETANPGFVASVKAVYANPTHLQDPALLTPVRQLASALLRVDPQFLTDNRMEAEYQDLRKLQGVFLRPRKVKRTEALEAKLKGNNVLATIYESGKSKEAGAWLGAIPKTEALTMSAANFRTAFRNRLLVPRRVSLLRMAAQNSGCC